MWIDWRRRDGVVGSPTAATVDAVVEGGDDPRKLHLRPRSGVTAILIAQRRKASRTTASLDPPAASTSLWYSWTSAPRGEGGPRRVRRDMSKGPKRTPERRRRGRGLGDCCSNDPAHRSRWTTRVFHRSAGTSSLRSDPESRLAKWRSRLRLMMEVRTRRWAGRQGGSRYCGREV